MADISKITLGGNEYGVKDAKAREDIAAIPAWAKAEEKPTYTADEVGADPTGTAAGLVAEHNTAEAAHSDIRMLFSGLENRLNALADSDDATLDQLSEIVAYIKSNRGLIDTVTTGKVSVSDIVDDLTTNVGNKPLSAAQGVALKALIDAISVPTKVSQLENDAEYITEAAIPTVPSALPNPKKLTFTGAVEAEYDGSAAVSVEIPAGGSGGGTDLSLGVTGATVGQVARITAVDDSGKPTAWEAVDMESGGLYEKIGEVSIPEDNEDITSVAFSETADGEPLALQRFVLDLPGWVGNSTHPEVKSTTSEGVLIHDKCGAGISNPRIIAGLFHGQYRRITTVDSSVKGFKISLPGDSTGYGTSTLPENCGEAITKISINYATGHVLTGGTTITLWGVRA